MRSVDGPGKTARYAAVLMIATLSEAGIAQPQPAFDCPRIALAGHVAEAARTYGAVRENVGLGQTEQDNSCWVDLNDAAAAIPYGLYWVDVRSAREASLARLGGTLHIPLAELPAKAFLKATPLVLIGSGRDDGDLGRACGELKRTGFRDIKLLRGGVRAWNDAGRPVVADAPTLEALSSIGPSEFHRQLSVAPWTIVAVGLDTSSELPVSGKGVVRIDSVGEANGVVARLNQLQADFARKPKEDQPTAIVVVARDESGALLIREAVSRAQLHNVLTLAGGAAGYQAFLAQQKGIAANAGASPVRPCGAG